MMVVMLDEDLAWLMKRRMLGMMTHGFWKPHLSLNNSMIC
jgi:hypothetical protein